MLSRIGPGLLQVAFQQDPLAWGPAQSVQHGDHGITGCVFRTWPDVFHFLPGDQGTYALVQLHGTPFDQFLENAQGTA